MHHSLLRVTTLIFAIALAGWNPSALIAHSSGDSHDHLAAATKEVRFRNHVFVVSSTVPGYTPQQAAIIRKIFDEEKPPAELATYIDYVAYTDTLELHGVSKSFGGIGDETSHGRFTYFAVQYPGEKRFFVVVYRQASPGGAYCFVERFTYEAEQPATFCIEATDNAIIYKTDSGDGREWHRTPWPLPNSTLHSQTTRP